jgi:hypothetical protein
MNSAHKWNDLLVTVSHVRKFAELKGIIETSLIKRSLTLKRIPPGVVSLLASPSRLEGIALMETRPTGYPSQRRLRSTQNSYAEFART